MGYERNDRRYGGSSFDRNAGGYDPDRTRTSGDYGRDYGSQSPPRDYRGDRFNDRPDTVGRDYGNDPRGYDYQDRGFIDRAGDEVRSWFGDDDAERRRRADERHHAREWERNYGNNRGYGNRGYGEAPSYGAGIYGAYDYGAYGDSYEGRNRDHDPSYRSWRDRQIQSLDRDYDEYRREHQSKFDNEFHGWRQGRQGQRDQLQKVQEHQDVVGSDGQHVGTVDHVRGDRILLTKSDSAAGGHHHSIPSSWIQSVDDKVTISKTADQAKQHWREEADKHDEPGLFGRGSTNLNRSFSGTY